MQRADYRISRAERHHRLARRDAERRAARAEQGALRRVAGAARRRAGLAVQHSKLWLGYQVRRGFAETRQLVDRLRTPRPTGVSQPEDGEGFLVVGHRGSAVKRVENTIESCAYALEHDLANAVEIDLSLTKDGHVVLWHDWNPNDSVALVRQLGIEPNVKYAPRVPPVWSDWRRMAHELTLAELREHCGYQTRFLFFFRRRARVQIPTFREFLDWAKGQPRLRAVFLDIKLPTEHIDLAPKLTRAMCSDLEAAQPKFDPVFMTTRESVFQAMRPLASKYPFSFDVEVPPGIVRDTRPYSGTAAAISHGNTYASIGRPALTLGAWSIYQEIIARDVDLRRAHNAQSDDANGGTKVRRLISWTINKRGEKKRLLELGVQGILTDQPRRLERLARRFGRKLA